MYEYDKADLVKRCGKFRMLDRLLVKLHASGHRVLLFSTMTKLLDLLEEYLRWREVRPGETMGYLRIDGATSLEDRSARLPADLCRAILVWRSSWVLAVHQAFCLTAAGRTSWIAISLYLCSAPLSVQCTLCCIEM